MTDVDFVITWVDGSDEDWLESRRRARLAVSPRGSTAGSDGVSRYRDLGLLKYWFRAVEANAPWVRSIHFVTETRLPEWLRHCHPKLHIVNGREINPSGAVTYNSHAVEACIPLIPELSEEFVYFNDDFFVSNPVLPDFYFRNGLPYAYPFPTFLTANEVNTHARLNACGLINDHFDRDSYLRTVLGKCWTLVSHRDILRASLYGASKRIPPLTDIHVPTPLLKSVVEEAFYSAPRYIKETRQSTFRSSDDVAPIYLAMMWHVATGRFFPVSKKQTGQYRGVDVHSAEAIEGTILDRRVPQFCINDGEVDDFDVKKEAILDALDERWPAKSSFEV